jgi:ATP synthase protein I
VARPESRSALSVGIAWASRITTIGLEFALPPLGGSGLDRWWGTAPLATIIGAVLGFAVGMMHLLRIAREASAQEVDRSDRQV